MKSLPTETTEDSDFSYLYIDADNTSLVSKEGFKQFAKELLWKRLESDIRDLLDDKDLDDLLGPSALMGEVPLERGKFKKLFELYANDATKARAQGIEDPVLFRDSIERKMRGALFLKEARENKQGNSNPTVYYGTGVFLRCSDANPRRLVELFNRFILALREKPSLPIPREIQHRVLTSFSNDVLKRSAGEQGIGKQLHNFLVASCKCMEKSLEGTVSSDFSYSIRVEESDSDDYKMLIKRAVDLSYLYPNERSDPEFIRDYGVFHIAYVFAPAYYLLPRKGKSIRLTTITKALEHEGGRKRAYDEKQLHLFGSEMRGL